MKYEVFKPGRSKAHVCGRPGGFMIWWLRIKPGDMVRCKTCRSQWIYEGCFGITTTDHRWRQDTGRPNP